MTLLIYLFFTQIHSYIQIQNETVQLDGDYYPVVTLFYKQGSDYKSFRAIILMEEESTILADYSKENHGVLCDDSTSCK